MYGIRKEHMDHLTPRDLAAIEADLVRLNQLGGEHGSS